MQGAIIDYLTEKGFGFIRDEQGEKRFFHINDVKDQAVLLGNLEDYYYTEIIDRPCYVVNFTPATNAKGLSAKAIVLTDELLNDRSAPGSFEARITALDYQVQSTSRIVQGIKKGEGKPLFTTAGSNGTYRTGYPEVYKDLFIDFTRTDKIGWGTIEARQLVLLINGREKMTDSFVQKLKDQLTGKKINIMGRQQKWVLQDPAVLRV
jgi:hypothetical protein